jgi:hypothetical protein
MRFVVTKQTGYHFVVPGDRDRFPVFALGALADRSDRLAGGNGGLSEPTEPLRA